MDNGRIASTSSGNSVDAGGQGGVAGSASSRSRLATHDGGGTGAGSSAHPAIKCPRCESFNTKFCYYNNYSQAQPRHFCKSCRRYWTEGGALRNVPVGGGCRKNKRLKQRPLLNMGVSAAGLLDPSSFMDDTTSNMLARLGSVSSPFPIGNFPSTFASNDGGNPLLNLMFSRLPESLRLCQSPSDQAASAAVAPYLEVGFPGLVHMKHGDPHDFFCAASNTHAQSLCHSGCSAGLGRGLEGSLGFGNFPVKGEHGLGIAGFFNRAGGSYELSSLYHDRSSSMHMLETSATATLDSIEDQLSSFSNLQDADAFRSDMTPTGLDQKPCGSMEDSKSGMLVRGPSQQQLTRHPNDAGDTLIELPFNGRTQPEKDMHERPLSSNRIAANNELSLFMNSVDSSWQQPPLIMNDIMMESQTNSLWNSPPLSTTRWQDSMHSLTAPPATAAGSVL